MVTIGITGGAGSGKSALLALLENCCNCQVIYTDDLANRMKEPDGICYNEMVELLGEDVLDKRPEAARHMEDGSVRYPISREKMAKRVFLSDELRKQVNDILHPAVMVYVLEEIETQKHAGEIDCLFIEAALLIEGGYKEIVDEMWVVACAEDLRRQRLKAFRGYTDKKVDAVFASQLKEEEFRAQADFLIFNEGEVEDAFLTARERLQLMGVSTL